MLPCTFGSLAFLATLAAASKTKPNIILVLVDDQDVHMQSLEHMPLLKKQMADEGTLFKSHYCTTSICCPARVSILTGKLSHNTNVTDVVAPYVGYPKFISEGLNSNYLPIWLQEAGYSTYYTGKLFNAHTVENYNNPYAAGWTSSDFLLDPYTYSYWNATWQKDKNLPVDRKPFFLGSAPIAPHSEVITASSTYNGNVSIIDPNVQPVISPPKPATRHANMFQDLKVPRTPDFNPEKPSGVSWVAERPLLNQTYIDYGDKFFRMRLQALQAVDEMVDRIVKELESLGIVENTYIIYTSDNGYHIGQYRLPPGKQCGFETGINVPLLSRGPGVPKGLISNVTISHPDLAPSIFRMAGIASRPDFDGFAIPLTLPEIRKAATHRAEHVGIEFWGTAVDEGLDSPVFERIRLHSKDYNLYYAVHCTNEHELYDMTVDPYQIKNLLPSRQNATGMPVASYADSKVKINNKTLLDVVSRLDALMMVMKSCKGETCIKPWKVLHPEGDVRSLHDAMKTKYDSFYLRAAEENSVSYNMCASGYIVAAKGLQDPSTYQGY
ncbi:alkaline-phosphatase-like protein [Dactylonectria macrodidyma]|uniref:Alkaline-phosphatase-like protein n=1 Tax=Dactylonectria macrodidyma TaxID=307937 RepID=A0A9P9IS26_9HYPO|nr:alkaline-phosphatase-like protein [Dactylonectria macrodidyma]